MNNYFRKIIFFLGICVDVLFINLIVLFNFGVFIIEEIKIVILVENFKLGNKNFLV